MFVGNRPYMHVTAVHFEEILDPNTFNWRAPKSGQRSFWLFKTTAKRLLQFSGLCQLPLAWRSFLTNQTTGNTVYGPTRYMFAAARERS